MSAAVYGAQRSYFRVRLASRERVARHRKPRQNDQGVGSVGEAHVGIYNPYDSIDRQSQMETATETPYCELRSRRRLQHKRVGRSQAVYTVCGVQRA